MKKALIVSLMSLLTIGVFAAPAAKDTVVLKVHMHCKDCENKIFEQLRFEKGARQIKTDLVGQRVRVIFNPNKNTIEGFQKSLEKIGYESEIVK